MVWDDSTMSSELAGTNAWDVTFTLICLGFSFEPLSQTRASLVF